MSGTIYIIEKKIDGERSYIFWSLSQDNYFNLYICYKPAIGLSA